MAKFKIKRRPTPPGAMLREMYLAPRGLSVTRFARAVECSRKLMSGIINGSVRLEPEIAARVAKVLGTSTELWVGLQAGVDAFDAERAARSWKPQEVFHATTAAAD
jgi:addiction module HigA family antidote